MLRRIGRRIEIRHRTNGGITSVRGGSRTRRNSLFLRKTRFAQVDMHIDQSRQHMTTRQIDSPVVRLKRDPTAYGDDFTVFDRQIARFEPSVPIELRTLRIVFICCTVSHLAAAGAQKNRATWTATLITWKNYNKNWKYFPNDYPGNDGAVRTGPPEMRSV